MKRKRALNDYLTLARTYCKNYKQYVRAAQEFRSLAAEQYRLMEMVIAPTAVAYQRPPAGGSGTGVIESAVFRREYHLAKAQNAERLAAEMETLVANLSLAMLTLTDTEQQVVRELFFEQKPIGQIDFISKSALFRTANKAIEKIAVCLFGVKAQWPVALV